MHTKSAEMSGRYLSQNEQQTPCNRITCTYSASEEKLQMGKKKKKKTTVKDKQRWCSSQGVFCSQQVMHQPGRAKSMRLTGCAWLKCETSASAKRAEIWNPTGATHNRRTQFDRKDTGVREIWKQSTGKRERGDEDQSPSVNVLLLNKL